MGPLKIRVHFSADLQWLIGYSGFTDLTHRCDLGCFTYLGLDF